MRGIKIPLQDFVLNLKCRGGLCVKEGGGIFVGHYGILAVSYLYVVNGCV